MLRSLQRFVLGNTNTFTFLKAFSTSQKCMKSSSHGDCKKPEKECVSNDKKASCCYDNSNCN